MIFGWTIIKTSVYDTITASGGITPQTTGDNGHGGRHNFWIYDKLTHNTTRWFTADGKIRGTYINHIGMGIAEDFSSCTPKVLQELEEIVDNRRKELLAQ